MVAAIGQGFGVVLVYRGITSEERAHEIRRGIYRCAQHRGVSADAGRRDLAASAEDSGVTRAADGTYTLRFRVFDKRDARKRHVARYGADRQQWPYNPRRPATDAERETWAARTETGRIVS